ncbi:MAG: histidine phosphatase family protein [Candidatus Doudnabacteria bacterium]|nr:histidine phosphatase family protein [Candidatus Doudnabacteria bacterium]
MKLVIVRHGETAYNKAERYMGHLDIGLNKIGKEQVRKLAARLAKEKFDYIYSSDLSRSVQTLDAVRPHFVNVPVILDDKLRERKLGVFEGLYKNQATWDSIPGNPLTRKPSKGESLSEMRDRINKFLKHLRDRHLGENILILTHGGVMRIMHHLFTRESLLDSFNRYRFENTAICIYDLSLQKPQVICFNDIAHLGSGSTLGE